MYLNLKVFWYFLYSILDSTLSSATVSTVSTFSTTISTTFSSSFRTLKSLPNFEDIIGGKDGSNGRVILEDSSESSDFIVPAGTGHKFNSSNAFPIFFIFDLLQAL